MSSLRIHEIFYSLQGESRTTGLPTLFIRLTGCPLRCQYCDTEYAFQGGQKMDFGAILQQAAEYEARFITVTGGEPLAQVECRQLLTELCNKGYQVSLETSGAMDIANIDPRVSVVMDLKTPDSKEVHRNLYTNIDLLKKDDQIKFVICSRQDYEWAKFKLDEYQLINKVDEVLFSPSAKELSATDLAQWIIADNLAVRFQIQLHKLLWNDEPGH